MPFTKDFEKADSSAELRGKSEGKSRKVGHRCFYQGYIRDIQSRRQCGYASQAGVHCGDADGILALRKRRAVCTLRSCA
jgi:hypothetical protein